MKPILLASLFLCGCTMIPGPHGTAQFWGDYQNLDYSDGPVHLKATSMIHSGVVRAHYHGITNIGAEVASTMIGLNTAQPAVKAATSLVPAIPAVVNRPTTRATATPKP